MPASAGFRLKRHNYTTCHVMEVRLRFTFLEFVDEPDESDEPLSPRSASEPPSFRPVHVQRTPPLAVPVPAHRLEDGAELPTPNPEPPPELWPSLGSAGHPELCSRRCLHFARDVCSHGAGCHFCHMTTHPPDRKMQRSDRELLHSLSLPDLLRTTWRVLERRIQARRTEAEPIFELLTLELSQGFMGPAGRSRPTDQQLQELQWSLSRSAMNFASLITFISSRCRPASRDQLLALLARMREEARP